MLNHFKIFKKEILNQMLKKLWGLNQVELRDRYVIKWLKKLKNNCILLDAGAGMQKYEQYCKHLEYVSQDFGKFEGGSHFRNNGMIQDWNATNCRIISDICMIPVNDETYDYVLCTEVFEHIPDPPRALAELTRVLKVGGKILITVPFSSYYHQEPYFYSTGLSSYWFEFYARENNLQICDIHANGNYYTSQAQEVVISCLTGPCMVRPLHLVLAFPYLIYLYLADKIFSFPMPRRPWGYFVTMKKS